MPGNVVLELDGDWRQLLTIAAVAARLLVREGRLDFGLMTTTEILAALERALEGDA